MHLYISAKNNTSSIINLLVIITCISIPFPIIVNNIAIACWAIAVIIHNVKNSETNYKDLIKIYKFYFIIFFLILISTVYTDDPNYIKTLERRFPLLIIPLLFSFTPPININKMLKYFSIVLLFLGLFMLSCAAINNINYNIDNGVSIYNFNVWFYGGSLLGQTVEIHPIYLSSYFMMSVFYLFIYKKDSPIYFFLYAFFSLFIILLASRIVILFFILWSIFVLLSNSSIKGFKSITVGAIALFTFFLFFNPQVKNKFTAIIHEESESFSGLNTRLELWKSLSKNLIVQNPFLGLGVGNHQQEYIKIYAMEGLTSAYDNKYNAHNQYIDITIQQGLIGLLVLILLSVSLIKWSFIFNDKLLFAYVLLILLIFCTESFLHRQKGIISFTFFTCALIHNNLIKKTNNSSLHRK